MSILTSSKELTDLIKNVDTVFHSKQAGSGKSMLNSLYRFVPAIREQLQVDSPLTPVCLCYTILIHFLSKQMSTQNHLIASILLT
jgi:hypothetical protein